MSWRLQRVREVGKQYSHIQEVYLDEDGKPWSYSEACLRDIIRFFRDWHGTPILRYPEDFIGEPDWLRDFDRMVRDALEEEKR